MPRALLAVALLALSACAGQRAETLAAAEFMGADSVETSARLLAIAADEGGPASPRGAQAVRALDRLGVQATSTGDDPLGSWRAALPDDPAAPLRGRLLGPAYRSGVLGPGESLETTQLFDGGQPAKVTLTAERQAPLAVTIRDVGMHAVCHTDPGNPRNCRWTPPFSARYAITVRNAGKRAIRYFLVIG